MATADKERHERRGWLPPRSGGYIPGETARDKPTRTDAQPPKGGGGVGDLTKRHPTGNDGEGTDG